MCTAITLNDIVGNYYFGRTMDFSYELEPSFYVCPRNYIIENKNSFSNTKIKNKYCFMGIGQNLSSIVFSEGVNEKGVAVAALYFPQYATYDFSNQYTQYYIDSLEMVNLLLGNCESVETVYPLLQNVSIIGIPDSITNSIAPLHWIVSDKAGNCMVIESRKDGIHFLSNSIGVLSNSPNFEWHMTNLRNYLNLSPLQYEEINWDSVLLSPFGQGSGGFGLPGDYTPPSRFIRSAFLKTHCLIPKTESESVITFFHIMESVSIPKGIVITKRGTNDYTQYTSFVNLQTCEYFFKTYSHNEILSIRLKVEPYNEIKELGKLNDIHLFNSFSAKKS